MKINILHFSGTGNTKYVADYLGEKLVNRIDLNYHEIIGFNSLFILVSVLGILQPSASAILHNTSTLLISTKSMANLIDDNQLLQAQVS